MVAVPSTMLPLGTPAPGFRLPEPSGRVHALEDFADAPVLVVMFLSNHCPYVQHVRSTVAALIAEYRARGIAAVGIMSNDVANYPDDAPERMAEEARRVGYPFPYLYDETQEVAKAYRAACTPDFFVFDRERRLVYRGQLDGSRPGNDVPVTGADLRAALEAALAGRPAPEPQTPSLGCNIKWRAGNEPEYFLFRS
jgi:peroxiredoxin